MGGESQKDTKWRDRNTGSPATSRTRKSDLLSACTFLVVAIGAYVNSLSESTKVEAGKILEKASLTRRDVVYIAREEIERERSRYEEAFKQVRLDIREARTDIRELRVDRLRNSGK